MPAAAVAGLIARLGRYRMRAAVTLTDLSVTHQVYVSWHGVPPPVPVTAPDPRLPGAGFRQISDATLPVTATPEDYLLHRLGLGLPDGPPDLEPDKTLLLEAGFDELGGVSWDKGCYMGQELTARTKYRGLVKRRLVPVTVETPAPALGTPILAEGTEVGTLRSERGGIGLAMLRIDALGKPLIAGSSLVTPHIPVWMTLPTPTAS